MAQASGKLSLIWPSLATIILILLGVVSTGLWLPAAMMFDAPGSTGDRALIPFALYSSAGPVAVLLGLVVGWVRIASGRRGAGLKWMIVIPVLWLVGLIGWVTLASALCAGSVTCPA